MATTGHVKVLACTWPNRFHGVRRRQQKELLRWGFWSHTTAHQSWNLVVSVTFVVRSGFCSFVGPSVSRVPTPNHPGASWHGHNRSCKGAGLHLAKQVPRCATPPAKGAFALGLLVAHDCTPKLELSCKCDFCGKEWLL